MIDARALAARHGAGLLWAAAIAWLGIAQVGAYHPRAWAWWALATCVVALAAATRRPLPALRSAGGLALVAGAGLTLLAASSIAWTDYTRHLAWDESARLTMYVAALACGQLLLAHATQLTRAVAWTAAGWSAIALGTLVRLRGDEALSLFTFGRLDWPLRYANASAALLVACALTLIAIGATRRVSDMRVRALVGGTTLAVAVVCASLAYLAQSRGAVLATGLALPLLVLVLPDRVTVALRIGAVVGALALLHDRLARVFIDVLAASTAVRDGADDAAALATTAKAAVADAAQGVTLAAIAALAVGAAIAWARLDERWSSQRARTNVLVGLCAAGAIAVGAALAGPPGGIGAATWGKQQWEACRAAASAQPAQAQQPPAAPSGSHFVEVGGNRCDFWRVARDNFLDHPLVGSGANSFQGVYVLHRHSNEEPRQAHSLPLQIASDLGVIGIALALVIAGAFSYASWKYVTSGPAREAALGAIVVTLAYWLIHASVDWLFNVPVITMPLMLLAGGLMACVSPAARGVPRTVVWPVAGGAALLAVVLLAPLAIADRAYREARSPIQLRDNPLESLHDTQRAATWAPLWASPVMLEARLLVVAEKPDAARDRLEHAVALEPENWSIHEQAARTYLALGDKKAAKAARLRAVELNPQLASTSG